MKRIENLFLAARETPTGEREAFLADACGSDREFRARLDKMLADAVQADAFFDWDDDLPSDNTGRLEGETLEGMRIGRYEILEKIGEGGFGSVYRAGQREPVKREVALKLIKLGMDTEQVVARFEAERQALAMMNHPGIATVLDVGATGAGRPYFVMELVQGIPITRFCADDRVSLRDRLRLFVEICMAVQHAHQKGIIHRDLKPSNILVTKRDGTPVPKVIDFGIAKATLEKLTDQTLHTRPGHFIGTPAYMSPEQADGSGADVDTRSDVYALGALLYELIAGSPPFDPKSLSTLAEDEVRRIIREDDPPRPSSQLASRDKETLKAVAEKCRLDPRQMARAVHGDLDWIVMKAMEKDRARRYGTALALAEDIERHLNHEPVRAAAPGVLYQWSKVLRRHRTAFVTLGLVVISLVLGLSLAIWQTMRADASQRETAEALGKVEKIQRSLEHENYRSNLQLAQALIRSGEFGQATSLLWRLPMALRSWEWGYLMAQVPRFETTAWNTGHGNISSMVVSNDGRYVITGGEDRRVISWDWRTREKRWERVFDHPVIQVTTDPTGRFVAVATTDQPFITGSLIILDQAEGRTVYHYSTTGSVSDVWWFPEGLSVQTSDGLVTRMASESWEILQRKRVPGLSLTRIRGRFPASDGKPGGILVIRDHHPEVLDPETLTTLTKFSGTADANFLIPYADASKGWAVAPTLHTVYRLLPDGVFSRFYQHDSTVQWIVALDHDLLAVAGDENITLVHKDGSIGAKWTTPEVTTALEALPDGRLLVASRTGFVRLYDPIQDGRPAHLREFEYRAECRNVFFTPSGRQLGFMAWDKKDAHFIRVAPGGDGSITTLQTPDFNPEIDTSTDVPGFFPPTGELVCHTEHQIQFYDIRSGGAMLARAFALPFAGDFFRFDVKQKRILFASLKNDALDEEPLIHALDLESGKTTPLPVGIGTGDASTRMKAFDLTPDGELAVISRFSFPSSAQGVSEWAVFRPGTGEVLLHQQTRTGELIVALHPAGKRVAVGCFSGAIEVWDTASGERLQRFQRDGRPITALRFMGRDGERLITASGDRRLRLWDWAYGEELLAINTTTDVRSIALSEDHMAIAHGGYQPAVTLRFALPWWFEQGDPRFYQFLTEFLAGN